MRLNLQYPPTPENAPALAAIVVKAARDISNADLDYSAESLSHVDEIIEEFRQRGLTSEQMAETIFSFGCYVGEVLVRNAGAKWRNASETSMGPFSGSPLVIELPDRRFCNPIGKAFKRLRNGDVDSLVYFYHVFAGAHSQTRREEGKSK
jgi:hypothetical protein